MRASGIFTPCTGPEAAITDTKALCRALFTFGALHQALEAQELREQPAMYSTLMQHG